MTNSNRKPNHLINETSPYLQAHAHNPVDWYPWGDEAFKRAKAENKLIFLSIGYHACHWCHVMEEESFEDESVAKILNEKYICIKVDREERKDLDAIYMKACQAMTGSGGWPLNLWLTPDRLPVYAGTYFPKRSIMNRIGLIDAAEFLSNSYEENPNTIFNKSFEIITMLKKAENHKDALLEENIVDLAYREMAKSYDPNFGGFSKAPKFPVAGQLLFLLESDNLDYRNMALATLKHMAKGGIYDHIGGGFARYSVDDHWMIPHFEKMLYDNAQLLDVYSKAYHMTKNGAFKQVIDETLQFLEDAFRHPTGGYYSAYDADSEGVEGKFYGFTLDEVNKILGADDGKYFAKAYNMTDKGNFEHMNIPNIIGKSVDVMQDQKLIKFKKLLLNYRNKRIKPNLDDKILSMSNGFLIHGLCSVYEYVDQENTLNKAISIYNYLRDYMMTKDGLLLASVREDQGNTVAMIDDYAVVLKALLKLYDVTFDQVYLDGAKELCQTAIGNFWDEEHGGFFVGTIGNKNLIYNPKEIYDGATPSGNSLMAMNLLKLFLLTDDIKYKKLLDEMVECFSYRWNQFKQHSSFSMMFIQLYQNGTKELKLCIPDESYREEAIKYIKLNSKGYTVRKLLIDEALCIEGKVTAYHCENGHCDMPKII